jgi:dihydropteroate synthase
VVAESGAGVVLMHMLGEPRTMQDNPTYGDVVTEVRSALLDWAGEAEGRGIGTDRIVIDPGIGFGKTRDHNLSLLKSIGSLTDAGGPGRYWPQLFLDWLGRQKPE